MKIAPAWRIFGSSAAGSATASSRCSGATRFASAQASSRSRTLISAPRFASDAAMIARRGIAAICRARARGHRLEQRGVGRDEDRLRELVVLGLREEIHRDPVGIGGRVGDHQDLGCARHHVDADRAEHAPLGRRDVGVAGTADLVDGGDRRRAVGERGDSPARRRSRTRGKRRRDAPPRARADCARRPAWARPSRSRPLRRHARGSRSSAPTTDTRPCRRGRRRRRDRAASPAGRARCRRLRGTTTTPSSAVRDTCVCARQPRRAPPAARRAARRTRRAFRQA